VGERSFGWILRLWVWGAVGFAGLYWLAGLVIHRSLVAGLVPVRPDWKGLLTALYFSFVTATSLGYGDIVPVGPIRLLAVAEGAMGLFLFGCLVTKLVSRRQEQLMEEIHRNTFESRLGRVRTNLHLVLTELDGMVRECESRSDRPASLLARVESAATVFNGELRAVHDLLYRPNQVPDERVLEGILAGVASALRAFANLIGCLPGEPAVRPSLRASLNGIAEVSREICSECVPRVYAPVLVAWMDEIQEVARTLADGGRSTSA
jgi:hypothetical protein